MENNVAIAGFFSSIYRHVHHHQSCDPPTEIPNYVWSKKNDPKPLNIKSSKLIEIKVKEFYHPSKEVALKAAKIAVRGKSGMYFGSMENGKGFHVYRNEKVVERHWVK